MVNDEIRAAVEAEGIDDEGFTTIGVLRSLLGRQSQYLANHFSDYGSSGPHFDEGLRVSVPSNGMYHSIRIHADDVEEFVRRYYEVYPRR